MAYLVLARKYRPAKFEDVMGQEHITTLLKKAVTSGKLANAYLFCGPRGIGKTSCARILAKSLNCQKGPTLEPCGTCSSCKEIAAGTSFDVLEIDGASNRGIDEVRTLRENVKFSPSNGQFKIYIIDEVHMLTAEAFNALLKTLEEPPEHAKFIFATTEPHKLPATILSRCQRYDFKRISIKVLVENLSKICQAEKLNVSDEALYAISKAAQGSFRDALSILDQIGALSEKQVNEDEVYAMLGLVEAELLFKLTDALAAKDCASALDTLDLIMEKGKDIKQLPKDLVEHFRNLMVMKIGGKSLEKLVEYPAAVKEQYFRQAEKFSLADILTALDQFIASQETSRITETLRTPLEIAFAKLTFNVNKDTSAKSSVGFVSNPTPAPVPAPMAKAPAPPLLKDKRGSVMLDNSEAEVEAPKVEEPQNLVVQETGPLDLEKIKAVWDALTYAVSREKMSLATFLQEGRPIALKDNRLIIGFVKEHEFYKETLERKDALLTVERIFSEKLKTQVLLAYKVADTLTPDAKSGQESFVQSALDTFKGKIVNKWHNE